MHQPRSLQSVLQVASDSSRVCKNAHNLLVSEVGLQTPPEVNGEGVPGNSVVRLLEPLFNAGCVGGQ